MMCSRVFVLHFGPMLVRPSTTTTAREVACHHAFQLLTRDGLPMEVYYDHRTERRMVFDERWRSVEEGHGWRSRGRERHETDRVITGEVVGLALHPACPKQVS